MSSIHIPFHQKYRPSNLDGLVGQEFISITLKQALLTNRIAPAYLFNGPRGTGKTSSARIFAKSLNCQAYDQPTATPCGKCELCRQISESNALDVIEIDAASNTGVENIREIIDRARFAPTQAKWKVYVIDECHMLSTAASNALLKTIEEPPANVVFILATTNPERVLTTIQSRCQRFDFKRIEIITIFNQLVEIAKKESIKSEEQALKLIAKRSNGGMRDALSLLDQLSLLPDGINVRNVQNLLGEVAEKEIIDLIKSVAKKDPKSILINCNKLFDAGNEPHEILISFLNITRDLLLNTINNDYSEILYTSIDFQDELNEFSKEIEIETILSWHNSLKNIDYQIRTSDNPRLWLEIHLTSLAKEKSRHDIKGDIKNEDLIKSNQIAIDKIKNKSRNIENEIKKDKIIFNDTDKKKSENIYDDEIIREDNISKNKGEETVKLKEKWELILSKVELPSTKMLLSQQAYLADINSKEVVIALAPNWENMIKSRKVIIEDAVKKIFGKEIQLRFINKKLNSKNLSNKKPVMKDNRKIQTINNPNIQDSKTDVNNQSKSNADSSKNLANFFNGEIVDPKD